MNFKDAKEVTDEEKSKIYTELNKAQQNAWNKGSGYFYWSYKLLLDTVNDCNWKGWDCWDAGKSADLGWFKNF